MMKRALRPVRRRIRFLRTAHGLVLGVLVGAALCLGMAAASFATPIEGVWRYQAAGLSACALLGPAVGALLPVSATQAARRADAAGLQERAQTALALEGMRGAMLDLQRADACAYLAAFPLRQALAFQVPRRIWIPGAICALLTGALLIVPNPQNDMLAARVMERKAVQAQADTVEKAAEAISEQQLTDEERRELRRLTEEMTRDLRTARDKREALAALDEKQKQMERLQAEIRDRIANETSRALASQPGLKGLSDALEANDAGQMQEALAALAEAMAGKETAADVSEQLALAAELAPAGAVQQGLSTAAAAALAGDPALAAQSLSAALDSAGGTGADIASLMQLARTGVAQAGSGQGVGLGSGNDGPGKGVGGTGLGTTQRDAGYTPGLSQSSQQEAGGGAIQDRVGAYERIYDPTRLGGDSEATYVQGQMGDGESQQLSLGPGIGDLSGTIPYDQVIGQYRQAAAQSMRRISLPATMQDWVNRYFDALID